MSKQILIADKSPSLRALIKNILSGTEYKIAAEAEDGIETIFYYKNILPDLVIMDIDMPDLDGIQVIKSIHRINPRANIIVCSALRGKNKVLEAVQAGVKDFIIKPFHEERFLSTVEKVFGADREPGGNYRPEIMDDITEAYNSKGFRRVLSEVLAGQKEKRNPISVAIFVINSFEAIKEQSGVAGRHAVLRQFVEIVRRATRQDDLIARFAANEFAIMLLKTDKVHGKMVATRIENNVKEESDPPFSVSWGIGTFPGDGQDVDALLEAARRNLNNAVEPEHLNV